LDLAWPQIVAIQERRWETMPFEIPDEIPEGAVEVLKEVGHVAVHIMKELIFGDYDSYDS
jgi:hypothetical protein